MFTKIVLLVALSAGVVACGSGPGSKEDLTETLLTDDQLSEADATCITDGLVAEYPEDSDEWSRISGNSFEELTTGSEDDAVPNFDVVYDQILNDCLTN